MRGGRAPAGRRGPRQLGEDRGVGRSLAEGPGGGTGPRVSALLLGEEGWKERVGAARRDKGLPPSPSGKSITGCALSRGRIRALPPPTPPPPRRPPRRRPHRGMGREGSPFPGCPIAAVSFSRLVPIAGSNKAQGLRQGFPGRKLRQHVETSSGGASTRLSGKVPPLVPALPPDGSSLERGFKAGVTSQSAKIAVPRWTSDQCSFWTGWQKKS